MKKSAVISECGKYRYQLSRIWDESKPLMMWIMMNPSTADANEDDPTITRCIGFAKSWGYGGMWVGNMFPYRATKPSELKKVGFEVAAREENWDHLREMEAKCKIVVVAHGNLPIEKTNLINEQYDWFCIGKTKQGNPIHPLFKPADLIPIPLFDEF